jgi:hypothetical protein
MKELIKFSAFSACFIVSMELLNGNSFEGIYHKSQIARKNIVRFLNYPANESSAFDELFRNKLKTKGVIRTETQRTEKSNDNNSNTIYLAKLGNPDSEYFNIAKSEIHKRFGWKVIIAETQEVTSHMLNSRGSINAYEASRILPSKQKIVYITEQGLDDEEGTKLRGYAYGINHIMIVRTQKSFFVETLIHEIGHTLGLKHCNDKTCIMAENNDPYDTGEFCKQCKSQLNSN